MALDKTVKNLDDIDEKYKTLYDEQSDGSFKLDSNLIEKTDGGSSKEISSLKERAYKQEQEFEAMKKQLNESKERLATTTKDKDKSVDSGKELLERMDKMQKTIENERSKSVNAELQLVKQSAIDKADGVSKLLSPLMHLKYDEKGTVVVSDASGKTLIGDDGMPYTPDNYLESLKSDEDLKAAFKGVKKTGFTDKETTDRIIVSKGDVLKFNPSQRRDYIDKYGEAKYFEQRRTARNAK